MCKGQQLLCNCEELRLKGKLLADCRSLQGEKRGGTGVGPALRMCH